MTINVMVVDDSVVIRGLVTRALEEDPEIRVVTSAADGSMAVKMAQQHKPDIVVLDIEMPVMDGITALPLILQASPQSKVLISSTLSQRNATISLEALRLGAADYIPKPSAREKDELAQFHYELLNKVRVLGGLPMSTAHLPPAPPPAAPQSAASAVEAPRASLPPSMPVTKSTGAIQLLPELRTRVNALAIASSTGGPQALLALFKSLRGQLMHLPIFITQHMPPTFTKLLADQISTVANRPCAEGVEGEKAKAGHIYLAPGNFHMLMRRQGLDVSVHLDSGPQVNFCRPAADPMLDSLVAAYGASLLTVVLTGMGADGMEGCRKVVAAGGSVIAQDEASSVVWGMPRAVAEHQLCQAVLPLPEIGPYLVKRCMV